MNRPIWSFWLAIIIILVLPAVYIFIAGYQEELYSYFNRDLYLLLVQVNFTAVLLFISFFTFFSVLTNNKIPSPNIALPEHHKLISATYSTAVIFTAYFFFTFGIQKIALLGSIIDSSSFRTIGYDDLSLPNKFALELCRKIFFPFFICYFDLREKKYKFLISMICFLLLAISTLDRFPFMIVFVYLAMRWLEKSKTYSKKVFKASIALVSLAFAASAITYIQYNALDVTLQQIVFSAGDFVVHRVLLVPSIAAIEIGISQYWEYGLLLLTFSRLSILWGGDYIGYAGDLALFVAPVGIVADTMRNFGYLGVIFVGTFMGIFVGFVFKTRESQKEAFFQTFLSVNLATYLVFGNLFTLGVFVFLVFLVMCRIFNLYEIEVSSG